MKKIIIALGLVVMLTGCNSKNEGTDSISEGTSQLETTGMTYNDYVQFIDEDFKNDDWVIAVDDNEELLMLVYNDYYLDLHKAKQYTDLDSFKQEWIDFTNTIYKTTQKYCEKLALLGFEGGFAMGIEDSYGEVMYMAVDGKWADQVFGTQGAGER